MNSQINSNYLKLTFEVISLTQIVFLPILVTLSRLGNDLVNIWQNVLPILPKEAITRTPSYPQPSTILERFLRGELARRGLLRGHRLVAGVLRLLLLEPLRAPLALPLKHLSARDGVNRLPPDGNSCNAA